MTEFHTVQLICLFQHRLQIVVTGCSYKMKCKMCWMQACNIHCFCSLLTDHDLIYWAFDPQQALVPLPVIYIKYSSLISGRRLLFATLHCVLCSRVWGSCCELVMPKLCATHFINWNKHLPCIHWHYRSQSFIHKSSLHSHSSNYNYNQNHIVVDCYCCRIATVNKTVTVIWNVKVSKKKVVS